ncbi:MAG: cytochrome c3 family protein [Ignavibacteriae bacterium]|nr:cytochrome c3 family protein [Ignavibacteriota bacterium]
MIHRYVLILVAVIVALGAVIAVNRAPLQADGVPADDDALRSRSLTFSHKKHIAEAGITDCATCHTTAKTSKLASDQLSTGHDACMTCHEEQISNENRCGYCHNNPADIQAIAAAKRDFIFSHEKHTALEGVECATCHQGLEQVEHATPANVPSMATCNTCHNDRKVSNQCETCHESFAGLLPADHERSNFIRTHSYATRIGGLQTDCQTCHTETFCQQCHFQPELKRFGARDLTTEPSHKTTTQDNQKQMLLQGVHELNYRFMHGIDAKSNQADCQSCHTVQTFCAECHNAGGNINQAKFKPANHGLPGFTTIGVGSGGGLHAEEARRDIESCVSCHDVEGQDPTCMTCHLGNGKVR